jgi:SRSO17 transposase
MSLPILQLLFLRPLHIFSIRPNTSLSCAGLIMPAFPFLYARCCAAIKFQIKQENTIEPRLLVIRKDKTKSGVEIKYSFTNANTAQYTLKAIAYMQAQRFFVEHCIKESKSILGIHQFQTRNWLAWYHQIALIIMTICFMLKKILS